MSDSEKLVNCGECIENYSGVCRHHGDIKPLDHDTQCKKFIKSPLARIAEALEILSGKYAEGAYDAGLKMAFDLVKKGKPCD